MASAKQKSAPVNAHRVKPKKKRPGIHAKKKTAKNKKSKNYVKPYRGQGR